MLWQTNEGPLFALIVVAFLAALELGFRLGVRFREPADDGSQRAHIASIQTSTLGLLALLLGFTFAMAVSRFDDRRALVLEEANAIGTAALRARLLPAPHDRRVEALLKEHVNARLAFFDAGIDQARLDSAEKAASTSETQLWSEATATAALDPRSVPTGLFIESLNAVFDAREKRRVALANHVPEAAIYLLLVVSTAALGVMSYGSGLTGRRRFKSNGAVALLIALVLVVILDIDRPRRGLIQVNQDSLIRLKASMDSPRH